MGKKFDWFIWFKSNISPIDLENWCEFGQNKNLDISNLRGQERPCSQSAYKVKRYIVIFKG